MDNGTRLGPYEILEPLGKGGMGEVWLAQDTRLGRKVAIKVLPEEFASDPARLARFEQEARAAAALNHPHIAAVYDIGFEREAPAGDPVSASEGGAHTGTHFMVQEHLQGESLQERLDRGPIPPDEALALAAEVAEALATAHRAGIIHRDLKPANIFVTEDGHAKILDFGLAKLTEINAGGGSGESRSPTMLGTVAGQVMGTAGYMSPEQAEGETDIDPRADIFAFGCVLYEMVSGYQAFSGKNVLDTLHRIANSRPSSLREVDTSLPADLERILDKCLAKRRTERYQHADDLIVDLRGLRRELDAGSATSIADVMSAPSAGSGASGRDGLAKPIAAGLVALAVVITAIATWLLVGATAGPRPLEPLQAFSLRIDDVVSRAFSSLAVSPDGRHIVYSINTTTEGDNLFLRSLDRRGHVLIPGTREARDPFFSPDSRWLAFDQDDGLYKTPLAGGDPFLLCVCDPGATATWSDDGFIYFSDFDTLGRVPDVGGEPEILARADSEDGYGAFGTFARLPGTDVLLGEAGRNDDPRFEGGQDAVLFDLENRRFSELVAEASAAQYLPSGHLVFTRGQTVYALAFDLDRLAAAGNPTPVLQSVTTNRFGASAARFSDSGLVAYYPRTSVSDESVELAWVERDGSWEVIPGSERQAMIWTPRLSPDGRRAAFALRDAEEAGIWIFDLERSVWEPFEPTGNNIMPVWSPDGEWIYFSSDRDGTWKLYRRPSSRQGPAETFFESAPRFSTPTDISPDGSWLIATVDEDVFAIPTDGGEPVPIARTPAQEHQATISPDGRWIAYTTDESGEYQVEIRPFRASGSVRQVSSAGGALPLFSRDGKTLYYRRAGALYEVEVAGGDSLQLGTPREVIQAGVPTQRNGPSYATIDDERFLMSTFLLSNYSRDSDTVELFVLLNWLDELERLIPTDGSR